MQNSYAAKVVPAAPATVAALAAKPATSAIVVQPVRPPTSATNANGLLPAWLALVGVIVAVVLKGVFDSFARRFKLKRDLYVGVFEAVAKVTELLGRLSNTEISVADAQQGFGDAFAKLAKAELVAKAPLFLAIIDFKATCGKAQFELLRNRMPVERLKNAIVGAERGMKEYQSAADASIAEMNRMNLTGGGDPERFKLVHAQWNSHYKELVELGNANTARQAEITRRQIEMGRFAVGAMKEYLPIINRMLKFARKDLRFRFDADAHLKKYMENAELAAEEFEKTVEESQKVFDVGPSGVARG